MFRRSQTPDAVERLLRAADPLPPGGLRSPEIDSALDDIGSAILARPRGTRPRSPSLWAGWRRLAMVLGTVGAVAGGGVAVASKLLSAHTGTYPRATVDVRSGGPGENLNLARADGLSVALQVSSEIPYPEGFQLWRDWLARIQVQESAPQPCPPGVDHRTCPAIVSTGALQMRFAASAVCAWIVDWRQQSLAGHFSIAAMDLAEVDGARDWPTVRAVMSSSRQAAAAATGVRSGDAVFGWLRPYPAHMHTGDVGAVDRLLATASTGRVCWSYDPAFAANSDQTRSPGAAFLQSLDRAAP